MLTLERLEQYWNVAVRDDACDVLVPSDIRQLVGECKRLRCGVLAIQRAAHDGRVCDDVAWFDTITTLYEYCDQLLGDHQQKQDSK